MADRTPCSECGGHGEYAADFTCFNCDGSGFEKGPLGFQEATRLSEVGLRATNKIKSDVRGILDSVYEQIEGPPSTPTQTPTPRMIWNGVPID